ncbi:MAG: flippase [Oscillospiraceae bacterium]|nr:flippase [Oscillospiraceae bacterium]
MRRFGNLFGGRMARNAFWLIGARVYHVAVNLVVSLLMAQYLGPANYGLINYAASFTALFTSVCTLGINGILVNELIHDERKGVLIGSSIGLRLCSSLCSVITIVALAYALNPDEPTTVWVVLIYSTTLIFQSFDSINCWYQANLESKVTAKISAVGYTVVALYKIWLLLTRKNVCWFAASHVVEYALVAALLLIAYRRHAGREQKLRFSLDAGRKLLSKSYHFILSGMMVAVYGQMDRVMLKAMIDETSVGYYSAAVSVTSMWTFILSAIIDSAKPVILEKHSRDPQAFERYLVRLYGAVLYISFAAAAGISLLAKPIIFLLYGGAYLEARGALCILCWETAFAYLGVARSVWMVPNGKQKYEKYIAGSGAVCNLILNAVMIPLWGVNGAALATLATQIFTNFIVGFFFREIRENNILILKAFRFWRYLK